MQLGSTADMVYLIVFILSLIGFVVFIVLKYRSLKDSDVKSKEAKPLLSLSLPKIKIPVARRIRVKRKASQENKQADITPKTPVFVNQGIKAKSKVEVESSNGPKEVRVSVGGQSLQRARVFLKLKNFLSAEDVALRLLEKDPHNAEIYAFLGDLYREQKNWKDSALCLEQAVALGEKDPKIFISKVEAWGRAKSVRKFKSSIKQALKNLTTNKAQAEVYFKAGDLWQNVFKENVGALQAFYSGVKLDSSKVEYKQKAKILAQKLKKVGGTGKEIEYFLGKDKPEEK